MLIRPFARSSLAAVLCVVAAVPAAAQVALRPRPPHAVSQLAAIAQADLHGIVVDEVGAPLPGAVVSALGSTTAFAVSDREGRFSLRNLPYGPYLVRAHLQGYLTARGRIIQVTPSSNALSTISLTRRAEADGPPQVLEAGIGSPDRAIDDETDPEPETHDHGEVAWRLRHLKRGVLKDAIVDAAAVGGDDPIHVDALAGLGRAVGSPARLASALLADLALSGQIDLLTSTSFDRPQDLFSDQNWLPRGIAFLALHAPTAGGDWTMRGAVTQGDLASWILAGSYVKAAPSAHRYEAGLSYAMQRYLGGNADALATVSNGSRNVGAIYGYDEWSLGSHLTIGYGARYARHDYLADGHLLSPRAGVTLTPAANGKFRVRAMASQREIAPGAEEFIAPASGLWLPPERTFSPLSPPTGFAPEHIDHFELAAEREWHGGVVVGVRAFRQTVEDQLVTLFGVALPGAPSPSTGHYYVGSGGDFEARGWGVSLSRDVADGFSASVGYTQVNTAWLRPSPDEATLLLVSPSVLRDGSEIVHDVTTSVRGVVPVTETRVFMVYKIGSGFADSYAGASAPAARFDVQLNQSLPFLNSTTAQWEMLVAVRNLFREELLDASVYDELLVVRPPKRVVGGVTVRF